MSVMDSFILEDELQRVYTFVENHSGSLKVEGLPATGKTSLLIQVHNRIRNNIPNKKCCFVDLSQLHHQCGFWNLVSESLSEEKIVSDNIQLENFRGLKKLRNQLLNNGQELLLILDNLDRLFSMDFKDKYDSSFFQAFKSYINENSRVVFSFSGNLWEYFNRNNLITGGQGSPFYYQVNETVHLGKLSQPRIEKLMKTTLGDWSNEAIKDLLELTGTFFPIVTALTRKCRKLFEDGMQVTTILDNLREYRIPINDIYGLDGCLDCFGVDEVTQIRKIAYDEPVVYSQPFKGMVIQSEGKAKIDGAYLRRALQVHYPRSNQPKASSDSETFNWIHFSDFHWPANDADYFWDNIKFQVLSDLGKVKNRSGIRRIDAIFFTGDFVKTGSDFTEAHNQFYPFLAEINRIFSPSEPFFFAVPGNHDLTRPLADPYDAGPLALLKLWENRDVCESIWQKRKNTTYWKTIEDMFANYTQWIDLSFRIDKTSHRKGLLPGEFRDTIRKGDRSIGIIGLNTAFLQLSEGNFYQKLDMHMSQLKALEINHEWTQNNAVNILLTHHPVDWLRKQAKDRFHSELNLNNRFGVHLCGHEHEIRTENTAIPGDPSSLVIVAPSLFGDKNFDWYDSDGNKSIRIRSHGYNLGSINLKDLTLRFWSRVARKEQDHLPWEFFEAQRPRTLQDGGTEPIRIAR